MSLVVALPTAEGLIVAADSRTTLPGGKYLDDAFKIVEPHFPLRTVFSITGTSIAVPSPPTSCTDISEYVRTTPRSFDLSVDVKTWLEQRQQCLLLEQEIRELSDFCCVRLSTQDWITSGFLDREVCVIVIGSYIPHLGTSLLAFFKISISSAKIPIVTEFHWDEVSNDEIRIAVPYGTTDYVYKHVLPAGAPVLGTFQEFMEKGNRRVSELTASKGAEYALDLINATSKMMEKVPHDHLVGGPVDIVLLGAAERPLRLKWKSD